MKKRICLLLVCVIVCLIGCRQSQTTTTDVGFGTPAELVLGQLQITGDPVKVIQSKEPEKGKTYSVFSFYENIPFYEYTVSVTTEEFYYRDAEDNDCAFGVVELSFLFPEGTFENTKALKSVMRDKLSKESGFYEDGLTDYFYDCSLLTEEEWEWLESNTFLKRKDESSYYAYDVEPEHMITVQYTDKTISFQSGMALYLVKNRDFALKWMEYYERLVSES